MKQTKKPSKKAKEALQMENKQPPSSNHFEDMEDEQLKGEIHENHTKNPEEGTANENGENKLNNEENKDENADKILIEIKPREDYLKEKISKIVIDTKILGGVNKTLEGALKNLETEIKSNQLLITEISKDLSKLIPKKEHKRIPFNESEDSSSRLKLILELKKRQNLLRTKLAKIIENEKLLENSDFKAIKKEKYKVEENLRQNELKVLKDNKRNIIEEINKIEYKIQELIKEANNVNSSENKKNSLKDLYANFERDKEIAEVRAKEYKKKMANIKQAEKIMKKMVVDEQKMKLEEEEKARKEKYDKRMAKIKEMEKMRLEDYKKQLSPYNEFINAKLEQKELKYLELKEKFITKEEKYTNSLKAKRKQQMRSVPIEEIEEFKEKFDERIQKNQEDQEEKTAKLIEEWRSRKESLPTYQSPFYDEDEVNKKEKDEEIKTIRIETFIKARKDYSDQIKEDFIPVISEKLQKEIKDRIEPKKKQKRDTIYDHKKKRIILKKREPSAKNKRITWEPKINFIDPAKSSNKIIVNKPKHFQLSMSMDKRKREKKEIPLKKIDYLEEQIKKRTELTQGNSNHLIIEDNNKWERMLKRSNKNIMQNVENVQSHIERMERETKQCEQLLKVNGGIKNNPEMSEKISNTLIDTIKAKLSILNTITETK